MTPESARKQAHILAGEFAQGVDPVAVRQEEARRDQTLRHAKANPVTRLNRLNQWADVRPAKRRIPGAQNPEWVNTVKTGLDDLADGAEMRDALLFLLLTGAPIGKLFGSAL